MNLGPVARKDIFPFPRSSFQEPQAQGQNHHVCCLSTELFASWVMSNNQKKKKMNLQSSFISRVRVRPPAWRHFVHCHRRERFVPLFSLEIHLLTHPLSLSGPQKQTFTNGWRTTSTPTPSSNTSPPKLYRTTRFSKQRVQRQRKDKKWREIKATSGWLVSRGKRIPRRIRNIEGIRGFFFFFQVEGFWFSSVS